MRNFRVLAVLLTVFVAMSVMAADSREPRAADSVQELVLDSAGYATLVLDPETEVVPTDGVTTFEGSNVVQFRGEPNGTLRYRTRRRAVRFPVQYFADLDGDGYGNIAAPRGSSGATSAGAWVSNGLDCNDSDPNLVQSRTNLVPDCNLNGIPDDDLPTTVCVGKAEDRSAIFHGPDGSLMARRFTAYRDARGQVWISLDQSPRNAEGRVLTDGSYGACPRL